MPLGLVPGKLFLEPASKTTLLVELVMQVIDLPLITGDIIILDVTEVASDVKLLGEGFADILQMLFIVASHAWSSHSLSLVG